MRSTRARPTARGTGAGSGLGCGLSQTYAFTTNDNRGFRVRECARRFGSGSVLKLYWNQPRPWKVWSWVWGCDSTNYLGIHSRQRIHDSHLRNKLKESDSFQALMSFQCPVIKFHWCIFVVLCTQGFHKMSLYICLTRQYGKICISLLEYPISWTEDCTAGLTLR